MTLKVKWIFHPQDGDGIIAFGEISRVVCNTPEEKMKKRVSADLFQAEYEIY